VCSSDLHDVINRSQQTDIAVQSLTPVAEIATKYMRFALGTPAHSHNSAEIDVAGRLSDIFPNKDIKAVWHGRMQIQENFWLEIFHKGPSAGTVRTKGNAARNHLKDRMAMDLDIGKCPADLYVCGHYHDYVESEYELFRLKWYKSTLVILPPMCSLGNWGRDAMKSLPYVRMGVVIWEIINGQIREKVVIDQVLDLRKEEKLC
jgi:hypothetical protein